MRNAEKQKTRRSDTHNQRVYLSHGEENECEIPEGMTAVTLRLKECDPTSIGTHSFISTFRPEVLLDEITTKMREQGLNHVVSDQTWKVSFECSRHEAPVSQEGAAAEA